MRGFMRSVRRATRSRYTPEEKIRIVLEGFRREVTVSGLCRREGMNQANYSSWFIEAGKKRLARNTVRDATRAEINQLERANGEMKEVAADLLLENHRLKKTAIPPLGDLTASGR
jgi:transposase